MPAGLASWCYRHRRFLLSCLARLLSVTTAWQTIGGDRLSDFWRTGVIEDSLNGQHVAMLGFMLTLAQHLVGRVATSSIKRSCRTQPSGGDVAGNLERINPNHSLLAASLILDGSATMIHSLVTIE